MASFRDYDEVMLKRIKYVSRFAKPLSADEIDKLAEQSTRNNKEHGITGVLMTSGGMFFQVIEGEKEHVDALYGNIINDKRHRDVLLLSVEEGVADRLFPDWSMKKVDLDAGSNVRTEPLKMLLTNIIQQRHLIDESSKALERAVWREMVDAGSKSKSR